MSDGLVLHVFDRFRNRKVAFFNKVRIQLKHDSIASTFSFIGYFDPFNIELKELYCVTHFHEVTIEYNGELVLTGVLTSQKFVQGSERKLMSFGGYSKSGVWEDVNIPTSIYPLQSNGLSLKNIAQKLVRPFVRNYGLEMEIDPIVSSKMNSVFKKTTASATQTIKDYISGIASQKDIILSHNEKGAIYFTTAKTDQKPIIEWDTTKETPKGVNFEMDYNGQGMHSHITMMKSAGINGGNAGQVTVRNPYVIGSVFRPITKTQTSGDDNSTSLAARRAVGNELRNLKLTIKLDSWDINGKIVRPNNIISLLAPDLYLYHRSDWFIESVDLDGDESSQTAILHCVLPEVYNDKKIISIFRNINLHALNE